ncbi:hypothetical protein LUZ62_029410 [Rhynchospora pubera]|uniref:Uncharacterized protein n=1 Tax=Rhynchospora pubera TaxID=906938 RepID=A0AAV8FQK4_9POAL|nr:hypothetical protein LUZ62_088388 [Rhynchospora pubera]KAJ4793028.1 hypothetical protein LUZ62_044274 [Rhynchospora pubera]KAJ4816844.1 hypothetical protein LUZ62_029410 [Rhynchospora pubera]
MSSSCKSAIECINSRAPVRATYVNLYKWPESDAEFVRSVARKRDGIGIGTGIGRPGPVVVDSYSCRQMYLRSYTFSKKETVPEKTMRCISRVKEKAAELPFILQRSDSFASGKGHETENKERNKKGNKNKKKKKNKKKRCLSLRKLVSSLFHRILSCTARVDVVDGLCPAGRE